LFEEKNDVAGLEQLFSDVRSFESMHQRITEPEQLDLPGPFPRLPNHHFLEADIDSRFCELRRMGFIFGLPFMSGYIGSIIVHHGVLDEDIHAYNFIRLWHFDRIDPNKRPA